MSLKKMILKELGIKEDGYILTVWKVGDKFFRVPLFANKYYEPCTEGETSFYAQEVKPVEVTKTEYDPV